MLMTVIGVVKTGVLMIAIEYVATSAVVTIGTCRRGVVMVEKRGALRLLYAG